MVTELDMSITDSEWEIMRVVWAEGHAVSKDIVNVLQQKNEWKPATIKTFIGRLVKKGMLHTETKGNKYIYTASISEGDFIRHTLQNTFSNICNKDNGKTIEGLISQATLSFKDIELLEKALEMKKKDAVEVVPCNCVPGQCNC